MNKLLKALFVLFAIISCTNLAQAGNQTEKSVKEFRIELKEAGKKSKTNNVLNGHKIFIASSKPSPSSSGVYEFWVPETGDEERLISCLDFSVDVKNSSGLIEWIGKSATEQTCPGPQEGMGNRLFPLVAKAPRSTLNSYPRQRRDGH